MASSSSATFSENFLPQRAERLAQALGKAEEAEHDRDLATRREAEAQHQLEIMTEKLSEQRNEITKELQSRWQLKLNDSMQAAQASDAECRRLRTEVPSTDCGRLQKTFSSGDVWRDADSGTDAREGSPRETNRSAYLQHDLVTNLLFSHGHQRRVRCRAGEGAAVGTRAAICCR